MSVPQPQHDTRLSGASDLWDMERAGTLLRADYFDDPPVTPPAAPSGGGDFLMFLGLL